MDLYLTAAGELFEPFRLLMLVAGVLSGLVIGVIPGLGGIFGMALLLPLTYSLDPYAAIALLLGLGSVTTTSDTIPAVFLGVPGTVGSMATVLDGHALAKKQQGARALGAAYTSSVIGGVFGAIVLAAAIPVMRPLVLFLDFGDFLALTIFGLTIVALLAGNEPLKGLVAALLGIAISYIGLDSQEGVERWTFGQLYLWDGLPTTVIFLGLFGIPELAALMTRGQIQNTVGKPEQGGTRRGIIEALRNWPLVLKNSAIGASLGAMPGVGLSVIDWIAYGSVARKPRPGEVPFGEGNIRGVIAPESANNAKEGGAIIPTVAFGVPGSASMSLLLGAFMIQGIEPGPGMLKDHSPLLVTMIFSIALANVLGGALCLGLTRQLARLATVRAGVLVPIVLVFIAVAAFNAGKDPMDLLLLLIFGLLGIVMKHLNWPRAALALGFVLGPNLERFFFLTYQISGWSWLLQPVALVLLGLALVNFIRHMRAFRKARVDNVTVPHRASDRGFAILMVSIAGYVLITATQFPFAAGIFPILSGLVMLLVGLVLVYGIFTSASRQEDRKQGQVFKTELAFMSAPLLLAALVLGLGHLAAPFLFLLGWAWVYDKDRRPAAVLRAGLVTLVVFAIFDTLISQPWPDPWVSGWLSF